MPPQYSFSYTFILYIFIEYLLCIRCVLQKIHKQISIVDAYWWYNRNITNYINWVVLFIFFKVIFSEHIFLKLAQLKIVKNKKKIHFLCNKGKLEFLDLFPHKRTYLIYASSACKFWFWTSPQRDKCGIQFQSITHFLCLCPSLSPLTLCIY